MRAPLAVRQEPVGPAPHGAWPSIAHRDARDALVRPGLDRALRLLHLCPREVYLRKMSRVRFHSMAAIAKIADVVWSGPGWPGYDHERTVQANIDRLYRDQPGPDLVVGYQPLQMRGFAATEAPRCLRYNEMYDADWTAREIEDTRASLVVCHHRNDFLDWGQRLGSAGDAPVLVHIPHCAERRIFRDYGLPKTRDLLLVGARGATTLLGAHYPLRDRLAGILQRMGHRYACAELPHPGYDRDDAHTDRYAIEFARAINTTKICVTCSGAPRSRFAKYVEVPMAGAALAADLPDEFEGEHWRDHMIVLDRSQTDEEIEATLVWWLEHDAAREQLTARGRQVALLHTQETYARRFVLEARRFLQKTLAAPSGVVPGGR
jgi:hypothetical protein